MNFKLPPIIIRLMGCLTWTITILIAITLIICIVKVIKSGQSALCIWSNIGLFVLTTIMGTGYGLALFILATLVAEA